jgi:hypothetical protein
MVGEISICGDQGRSRCGSVRGCPVVSWHVSPGPAPQVGQRTACTCLRVVFLTFMVVDDADICGRKMVSFAQGFGYLLQNRDCTHNARIGSSPGGWSAKRKLPRNGLLGTVQAIDFLPRAIRRHTTRTLVRPTKQYLFVCRLRDD